MRKLMAIVVFLALCGQAAGQAVVLDLAGLKPGVHFWRAELSADGRLTLTPLAVVTIGGLPVPPVVPPVVPPTPPTPPAPEIPLGEFGMTRLAHAEAMKIQGEPRKLAAAIADNLTAEAAAVAAGARKTIQESLDSLKAANRATLAADADRAAWLDWFVAWQGAASAANAAGKLKSLEDYAKAFTATADGLRLVK